MAKIRLMSYLDQGAPQYLPEDRDAILKLMKMANETSYNTQYPTTLVIDRNSQTIHLSFNVEHGFKEGHLLEFKSTDSPSFQSTNYRVISSTASTLICKIDNLNEVEYPDTESSSTMFVKHKHLDWEVVFSSATQYSIRSKDPTSTRNVLTLKEPSLARLKFNVGPYTAPACVSAHASTNVDSSTGEILNSYTAVHNYQNTESFYWCSYVHNFVGTNYTPSAAAISNRDHYLPWWIIGNDKVFYLIVGAYHDQSSMRYRSASRSNDNYISRQCYMFGDPEYLGDPNYIDMGGTLFSALYKPGGINAPGNGAESVYPMLYTESHRTNYSITDLQMGQYFLRSHDMQNNSLVPISYSTIDYPYSSTVYNFSNGGPFMQYPHLTTRGLIFFPFFTRVYQSGTNTQNYYRSIMPFARFCPINLTNIAQQWYHYDNNIIKSADGKMNHCVVRYSTTGQTIYGAFINELD